MSEELYSDYDLTKWRRLLCRRDCREIFRYEDPVSSKVTRVRMGICAVCGDQVFYPLSSLQAHHIKPKSLYPELALHLHNGVMVCTRHHQGEIHNFNPGLDVRDNRLCAGWRQYVDMFQRWNALKQNADFNEIHQTELSD